MKKIGTFLIIGVLALGATYGVWFFMHGTTLMPVANVSDYNNTSYILDGETVTLVNGLSEVSVAPGSASKVVTKYFGNTAEGDLNGDGIPDTALLLTQESGGSGMFYYLVVALKTTTGYSGTSGIFLGDRIAPQTTEIKNGEVIVNYAKRAEGEPMTTAPSIGVSKYVQVQGMTLVEVQPEALLGEHCGGNMTTARMCASGLRCAPSPESHLPFGDVGGVCVAN